MKKIKTLHTIFFIICLITIIFYFALNYAVPFAERPVWKEYLWIPFYFTTISNVACTFLFGFKAFAKQKLLSNKKFIFFEFLTLQSIFWTGFAYTLILSWKAIPKIFQSHNKLTFSLQMAFIFNTTLVHFIVPVIAITNFFFERINLRKQKETKMSIFYYAGLLLASPFGYLILNLSIYFALGAHDEDNPYPFMAVLSKTQPWIWTTIYFIFTFSICYLINLLLLATHNKFAYDQKQYSHSKNVKN